MLITWICDLSENVFDHSGIYEVEKTKEGYEVASDITRLMPEDEDYYPDLFEEGIFELTGEGEGLFSQWCDDASLGYDLCYGRAKGLANRYTKQELWEELTTN